MALLSTADLARMRATALELLDTTCTIESKTATTDSMGGETYSWAAASSDVACRLNRYDRETSTALRGDRQHVEADWVVSMAHDQAVTIEQRIVVGSLTLEPVWVNSGKSVEAQTRVLCREVA